MDAHIKPEVIDLTLIRIRVSEESVIVRMDVTVNHQLREAQTVLVDNAQGYVNVLCAVQQMLTKVFNAGNIPIVQAEQRMDSSEDVPGFIKGN